MLRNRSICFWIVVNYTYFYVSTNEISRHCDYNSL